MFQVVFSIPFPLYSILVKHEESSSAQIEGKIHKYLITKYSMQKTKD